jgi:hypothetical protein
MKPHIEMRRTIERPEFEMPRRWRMTGLQTWRIARRRQNAALRVFGQSRNGRRTVRRWRLDNPFMTEEAWRVVLREAKDYYDEQRFGRRRAAMLRRKPPGRVIRVEMRRCA